MKLVFRTTPQKSVQIPAPQPPVFFSPNSMKTSSDILTRLSFSGNMIDRIKSSGEPCGSCGGR